MRAVNLIPSEQRGGGTVGSRSNGAAFAVLGLLAGVVILTFLYGMAHHQFASRRVEAAKLTARAQQIQAEAAQLAPYTSFMQMREQRMQSIAQLINSRFDWAGAMGELSRVLPSDVAISSLQGTVGSPTGSPSSSTPSSSSASSASVASATPAGATPTFTLAGCAASQTVVAQTLLRLRLISGVSDVSLQSSTKSASGSSSSSGGCPANDPTFSVDVAFEPLPSPPSTSTEALESTVSATGSADARGRATGSAAARGRTVSSASTGANR
jgi:Tfp pilus assembly protein PilN